MTTYGTIDDLIASPQASFSRPSSALMAGADGVYREYATNVLRRADGVGAVLEVGRGNQVPYAIDFSQWSTNGSASRAVSAEIAPDGGGCYAVTTPSGGPNRIQIDTSVLSGDHVVSAFVKAGTLSTLNLRVFEETLVSDWQCDFNLDTETVRPGSASAAFIENVGNGWYRIGFTCPLVGSGTAQVRIGGAISSSPPEGEFYLWQAQLEADSATTPIITSGATATRDADELRLYPAPGTYDVIVTFDDDSTQTFAAEAIEGDGWLVTVGLLDRPIVKSIRAIAAS